MDLGLKNKRALVTGASRGLGRAIAMCLAKEGAHVSVAARTKSDLDALLNEIGPGHHATVIDLMSEGAPGALLLQLAQHNFDIVVHNLGGTLGIKDPFCSIEDWRKVYRLNFEIAVELNNLIVPGMQKRKWGRVVHISSIASMENQGPVTYCAIKAALTAYTRSLGGVVAPDGVVISAVLPGAVFTEKGYWDTADPEHDVQDRFHLTVHRDQTWYAPPQKRERPP